MINIIVFKASQAKPHRERDKSVYFFVLMGAVLSFFKTLLSNPCILCLMCLQKHKKKLVN